MLKIRLLAVLISISLTALTLYIAPKLYFIYNNWVSQLNQQQNSWLNYSQISLGFIVAVVGFWRWKVKRKS